MKDSDGNLPNGVVSFINNAHLENHLQIRRMTTTTTMTTTMMMLLVVVATAAVVMPRLGDQSHEKRRVIIPTQPHPKKRGLFQLFPIISAFMPRMKKRGEETERERYILETL
jgi:hypothetical protein